MQILTAVLWYGSSHKCYAIGQEMCKFRIVPFVRLMLWFLFQRVGDIFVQMITEIEKADGNHVKEDSGCCVS